MRTNIYKIMLASCIYLYLTARPTEKIHIKSPHTPGMQNDTFRPTAGLHMGDSRAQIPSENEFSFHTLSDANETDSMSMSKRMRAIREVCHAHPEWNKNETQGEVYIIKGSQSPPVAYCGVPKVGCTFWKRVLRFINKDYDTPNITKPNQISRMYTHMMPFRNTAKLILTDEKNFQIFQKIPRKFMFTRDPYTRQWSAYLDKFFLPDFWNSYGKTASTMFRKRPLCGHDVSFEEYLRYIIGWIKTSDLGSVKAKKRGAVPADRHFQPISDVCNPCKVNFSFIGYMNNFARDSQQIMEEFDMFTSIKDSVFSDVVKNEIRTLSEYYLDLAQFRSQTDPGCYSNTLVSRRLWRVFQINGYLGNELEFPEVQVSNCTSLKNCKDSFISKVLRVRDIGSAKHSFWMKQRRQSLVNAYRDLPEDLLKLFREIYAKDFELFGYDSRPGYIFT